MDYLVVGFLIVLLLELDGIRRYTRGSYLELQDIQKEFHEQIQWSKKDTFADKLREWIGEVDSSLSKIEINTDSLSKIETNTKSLSGMDNSLSAIEFNTKSRKAQY
jgi:hypothetical protein